MGGIASAVRKRGNRSIYMLQYIYINTLEGAHVSAVYLKLPYYSLLIIDNTVSL